MGGQGRETVNKMSKINIYYVRYSFVHTSTVEGIRDLWEEDTGILLDSLRKIEGKRRRR